MITDWDLTSAPSPESEVGSDGQDRQILAGTPRPPRIGIDPRLARNAVFVLVAQVSTLVIGFLSIVVAGRVLGPGDLGIWRTATSIQAFVVVVGDLGLTTLATRELSRDRALIGQWTRRLGWVRVAATSLAGIVVCVAAITVEGNGNLGPVLAWCMVGAVGGASGAPFALQAEERFGALLCARLLGFVPIALVGLVVVGWEGGSITALALAWAVGLSAQGLITAVVARRRPVAAGARPLDISYLMRGSLAILVTALSIQLVLGFDALVLFWVKGANEAGLYAAAYSLAAYTMLVGGALMTAAFPRLSRTSPRAGDAVAMIRDLESVLGAIGIPVALVGLVVAPPLLSDLFGAPYRAAWFLVVPLAIVPLLGFFNLGIGQALQAIGRQRAAMNVALAAGTANVVANLILVPIAGMVGAAAAAAVTELVTVLLYSRETQRSFGTVPIDRYLSATPPAAIAAGVAAIVFLTVNPSTFVLILIAASTYGGLLMIMPSRARASARRLLGSEVHA